MLRYLRRLADRDFALDRGMIPLGSCTMKLNATAEMEPVSLPGFADVHPFAPAADTEGYASLVDDLEEWLARVTGYARVSVQPNAGSQGELAGLLAIRAYHQSRGDHGRDVCLIPSSAHGTNAASAVMAGMRVVVVAARRRRDGRPRRPGAQVRGARGQPGRHDGHVPLDPRCLRGGRPRYVRRWSTASGARSTSTAPTSTRCSAWPSRASSGATSHTSTCTRPFASLTVVGDPAWVQWP